MTQKTIVICAFILLCCAFFLSACAPPPAARTLADRFQLAGERSSSDAFIPHFSATRNGRREDAIRLVAPVAVRTGLGGLSGKYALEALVTPVFDIGDGLQLDIFIFSAGERRQACQRYFDPARNASDRQWIPLAVPFELAGQSDSYLEIQLSGGPQGDLTADWLALARMRISKVK